MKDPVTDPLKPPESRTKPDESKTVAEDSETLLETGPQKPMGLGPKGERPEIRDHELIMRVGQGSYGEVWLARNVMGTYRAVKIVYRSAFEHARPFEREFTGIKKFEPISRSHDGFVDILQVGRTEEYFYYVMELADDQVTGPEIDPERYAPKSLRRALHEPRRLPFEKCVELGISLTQALGHLHHHGLIHRDIKPSNIIVVNGIPKVADIGLVVEQAEAKSFVGTEGFIPPEGPGTPQADIYSLGKVLYELATGKDRHEFPALPTLLGDEASDTHLLELNSVFLKACQSDIKLRYQTAEAMRDDLLLLQSGKSVKRAQAAERRLAWLMKVSVAGIIITLLALAGIFVANRQAKREASLRQQAQRNLINSYVANGDHLVDEGDLSLAVNWYVKALEIETDPAAVVRHRLRIGATLHLTPKLVQLLKHDGVVNDVAFSSDGRLVASASDDKTAQVWDTQAGELLVPALVHSNEVLRVIFSPDNQRLLTIAGRLEPLLRKSESGGRGEVKLWNSQTGMLLADVPHPDYVTAAEFSKDGEFFATGCFDGLVRICDARNGTVKQTLPHAARVMALGLGADGTHVVTSADDSRLRLWLLQSAVCLFTNFVGGAGKTVAVSPDGRVYGGTSTSSGVALYNASDGHLVQSFMGPNLSSGAAFSFSPEGRRLLIGTWDQRVSVFDVGTGMRITTLNYAAKSAEPRLPFGARFSPDGRTVLTWMQDGTARVWGTRTGSQLYPPLHHAGPVTVAAFSPESRRVATAGSDGLVKVWDLASDASLDFQHSHYLGVDGAEWSPDGRRIFVAGRDVVGGVFDTANGEKIGKEIVHDPNSYFVGGNWSRDGRRLLTADGAGTLRVWDGTSVAPITPLVQVLTNTFSTARLSPDGERVAVSGEMAEVRVLDAGTGSQLFSFSPGHTGEVVFAGFTYQGGWLFTKGQDGIVRLWNPTNGTAVSEPMHHTGQVLWVCSNSDESRLATASEDGSARLWQIPSGRALLPPLRHRGKVWSCAFSPDNRWLVTASEDGTACVWDARSGTNLVRLDHGVPVTGASFNRDGKYIATASSRGARIWDALTGEPLSPWLSAAETETLSTEAKFSPVDDQLAICDGFEIRIWHSQPDSRSVKVLQAQSLVIGAARTGVSTTDLFSAWNILRAACPDQVAVSPAQALRWHRALAEYCYVTGEARGLEANTKPLRALNPDDKLFRRWAAVGLLNQGRASQALALDAEVLPGRSPNAPRSALDLSAFYNRRLDDSDSNFGNDGPTDFTPGLQTLGGVQFDVRGAIHLRGLSALAFSSTLYPAEAPPIPINARVSRFHMLQLAFFDTTEGALIGRYVLRYADGDKRELPIRYGIDVRNWWQGTFAGDRDAEADVATIAWRGEQRNAKRYGASIRFFKRTYENPRPEVEVISVEFESTMTPCSPVLLAITVE